jgi:hypothetical protein
MTYKDRTYCASPDCNNKCGRKMTNMEIAHHKAFFAQHGYDIPVSYGYFCDKKEQKEIKND